MSIIVKHRTDLDLVAERVGVEARRRPGAARQPKRSRRLPDAGPPGLAPRLLVLRGAARRGRRGRHLRDARRVRGARRGAAGPRGGLPRGARRDARQVAGGPARVRAALRPLLLPRRRGRGARARHRRGARFEGGDAASTSTSCARRSARRSRDGNDGEMRDLARLAIAAFGRQGEGSGVIGVDVQRIRRALGLQARSRRECRAASAAARPRAASAGSSATCAASSSGR